MVDGRIGEIFLYDFGVMFSAIIMVFFIETNSMSITTMTEKQGISMMR